MQDITEKLQSLDVDGKQYAHFFAHVNQPGDYGIWVRERTPEYVSLWLAHGPLAGYKLELSIEMSDATFCDYMAELFPTQKSVHFLKTMYAMPALNQELANTWAAEFKNWKQEKIRLNRVKWLESYPWVMKATAQQITADN